MFLDRSLIIRYIVSVQYWASLHARLFLLASSVGIFLWPIFYFHFSIFDRRIAFQFQLKEPPLSSLRSVGRSAATLDKDRKSLCRFTFVGGRQCRTPRSPHHPHFCSDH